MKNGLRVLLPLVAGIVGGLIVVGLTFASPLLRPNQGGAPTVVSYQGHVTVGSSSYNGTGYFKFAVVNAAGNTTYWSNDGTASGGNAPTNAVPLSVSYGLFNVLLGDTALTNMTQPMNAAVFSETDRYLRVWFSTSAGGPFTRLSPDRQFAAVPYALQAEEAKNADLLDGNHASAFQQNYQNVRIVAKGGSPYTTITDALNSITDASVTNRYLVKVMPGVYNERVTMKHYVDIEGAGEQTTKITYGGSANADTGTVIGANDAELRFLTVENTGGSSGYNIAVYSNITSLRLTHVTITATASVANRSYGVYNYYCCSYPQPQNVLVMKDVTVRASSPYFVYGVYNLNSFTTIQHSDIQADTTGYYSVAMGVYNESTNDLQTVVKIDSSLIDGIDNLTRTGWLEVYSSRVPRGIGYVPDVGYSNAKCLGVIVGNRFEADACPRLIR